jgi:hypothetical protein
LIKASYHFILAQFEASEIKVALLPKDYKIRG